MTSLGFPVTVEHMNELAGQIGEKSLFGRVGGAPTLAVGMAHIFSNAVGGRWLDLWYHFAIMFEALFILTTIDAGTRVGRYLLQDLLGHLWKPLGDTRSFSANFLASVLLVSAWGYFLIQGVRDPLGGINSLWPLFGIANQMLAAIALCLATTVILKMTLVTPEAGASKRSPLFALVTVIPLVWLLTVTFTAGVEKIWHSDPRIGFLAQAKALNEKLPGLGEALAAAQSGSEAKLIEAAKLALQTNRTLRFNNLLDAGVAFVFLGLVSIIVLICLREWLLLLARKRVADLRETPPVWLPDYAVAEAKPLNFFSLLALGFALAKELSGEAQLERARQQQCACELKSDAKIYIQVTEERFNGVRRCC
jgi:carbon starvation protein